MYKLVIADDEKIIRMGLKNVVDWGKLGFEISEIFTDGQEVIEYLNYMTPDVVLTDIKMSHVSGLDVAKFVFEQKLPCKVVLISGYQEFDLAVQGMKYGAEDYLLKPTNVENIIETFTKLKKQLDTTSAKREKERVERERIDEAIPILEEQFFADLVLGGMVSEEYIRSRINILYPELDVENSVCLLADILIRDYDHFIKEVWEYGYDQLGINLANFLRIYKKNYFFHIVYKSDGLVEVVGIHAGGLATETDSREALKELVSELEQSFRFKADYKIRCIYDSVFEIGRLKDDTGGMWEGKEERNRHIAEQKKLVMSNISMGNIVTAQKLFHNILKELNRLTIPDRNNAVIELLSTMRDVIKEVNEKLFQSLQPYFNYSLLAAMSSAEEIAVYCDRIFDRIRMADEKKEYYDTDSLINKARSYIQENIHRDISQEGVANQLYICPAYLSRLFKKQTGETFTQYVTRVKMERAVELLKDPRYKTYQVSEMLGYKTPRYFSRLFRMQTGLNPSEYRSRILHLGGEFNEI